MKKRLPFTALELVLVISIAAILLSISLPAFYHISEGRRLTAAMTAISANIALARARAVSDNTFVALIFNTDGNASSAMRMAELHKQGIWYNPPDHYFNYYLKRWLDDSSWEGIEDGVIIPNGIDNFHEENIDADKQLKVTAYTRDFQENVSTGGSSTLTRVIIFSPRGQIVTKGAVTNPIVIRVVEAAKVPGSSNYLLKKTGEKEDGKDLAVYGILSVNPLSCKAEMSYETAKIP